MPHTIGIPLIGGSHWVAGWNYMINLVETLAEFGPGDLRVCLLAGTDIDHPDLDYLGTVPRSRVVRDARLNASSKNRRLIEAVTTGLDHGAWEVLRSSGVDVVFEAANFFGWRLPIPAIAWVPDLQHRGLPSFFTKTTWLRREAGLRAQFHTGRMVMLSSRSAETDCLDLYPFLRGRTRVIHFAVKGESGQSITGAFERVQALGLSERYFFMPNQLWAHKNHRVAVEAAGHLKASGNKSLIVATGPASDHRAPTLRKELDALIAKLSVDDNFRLLGHIPYADVRALGLCASAIINPSLFEGWSTTVEEAKSVGTPLILSNLQVHIEQAPAGTRFFAPHDAAQLAQYIEDMPTRTLEMVRQDRDRAAVENLQRRRDFAAAFAGLVDDTLALSR